MAVDRVTTSFLNSLGAQLFAMNESSGPTLAVEEEAAVLLSGRISIAPITYFYVEDFVFPDVDFTFIWLFFIDS